MTTTVRVAGMSCGHCVRFVADELEAVPGVESVAVDLATSMVTVVSDRELEPAAIRTAIEAAGYEVAD
ncbi:heavy-metal-associated domain-containing protein [Kribbella sp. NBC_01484]|uniref:heavy-metal-associated domain-containing protein n=1 Tax=Kribbella sp. NBC_01484 TaxID=2903579 RepID=UPI002E318CE5|nr:heavy metal-associated domain-containing protein [Kribbella sp. NBC_01484]